MVLISRLWRSQACSTFVSLATRGSWECSDLAYPPKIISLISNKIAKYFEGVEQSDIEAAEILSALVQSLDAGGHFTNKK